NRDSGSSTPRVGFPSRAGRSACTTASVASTGPTTLRSDPDIEQPSRTVLCDQLDGVVCGLRAAVESGRQLLRLRAARGGIAAVPRLRELHPRLPRAETREAPANKNPAEVRVPLRRVITPAKHQAPGSRMSRVFCCALANSERKRGGSVRN